MASAGFSLRQLAVPVLGAAAIVMTFTYACVLVLAPAGQRVLGDKIMDIRADIAGALLNEGEFNPVSPGLTVFIRQLSNSGEIRGILVHDGRDRAHPITYLAEKGILAKTPAGTRVIMQDGTVETGGKNGEQLQVLNFASYTINHGPVRQPRPLHLAQDRRALSERTVLAAGTGREPEYPRPVLRRGA